MSADLREALRRRVLVLDGAMGTLLLDQRPDPAADLLGAVGCPDVLCLTRPERVEDAHARYLAAGCDAVETNTFCANPLLLARHGLEARTRELNEAAARIARRAVDHFATAERPRFVLGAVGPSGQLPALGEVSYDALRTAYAEQVRGLVEGGVDALLVETCQDPLQAKAAVRAALDAREAAGRDLPLLVSLTMEVTGAMRVGTELEAALAILDPLPIDALSLNCATGPREMGEHVRALGRGSAKPVGVYPNAGLPQLVDGRVSYPLTPRELADWLERFVEEDGLGFVGGCCGTTPEHMEAVVRRLGERAPQPREVRGGVRLAGPRRAVEPEAARSVRGPGAGPGPLLVGALDGAGEDVDGALALARRRLADGCTVLALRLDPERDPRPLLARLGREVDAPLSLACERPETLAAGLALLAGRTIVGPLPAGEGSDAGRTEELLRLARRHGAVLSIRAPAGGSTAERLRRTLELVERCRSRGLRPEDLFVDPLAPSVLDRSAPGAAGETLGVLWLLREELPGLGTWLDARRLAAGLPEAAALAVQAVFLDLAARSGLTAAVVGPGPREPIERVDPRARELAHAVLFEGRGGSPEPLEELLAWCAKRPVVVRGPRPARAASARPPAGATAPPAVRRGGPVGPGSPDERAASRPEPPFLGVRVIERIPLQSIVPYVDQDALFGFHWGHGRRRRPSEEHRRFLDEEVRPLFFELARRCDREGVVVPRACYGYFRCVSEGDALALLAPDGSGDVLARLSFPRQAEKQRLCVADHFDRADAAEPDVVALQVVTLGAEPARAARAWYADGRQRDSRHLQGFAVEAAEALAEVVHRQIRGELGIAGEDEREPSGLFRRAYRGCRYTFGEPACPAAAGLGVVLGLLRAAEIGVELDGEGRLSPEHSSAAVVCHHPDARFFTL